jgi:hypothetical protein
VTTHLNIITPAGTNLLVTPGCAPKFTLQASQNAQPCVCTSTGYRNTIQATAPMYSGIQHAEEYTSTHAAHGLCLLTGTCVEQPLTPAADDIQSTKCPC